MSGNPPRNIKIAFFRHLRSSQPASVHGEYVTCEAKGVEVSEFSERECASSLYRRPGTFNDLGEKKKEASLRNWRHCLRANMKFWRRKRRENTSSVFPS